MPVHPTQLYALVLALVGLGVTVYLRRIRSFSGQAGVFAFAWFVVSRMGIVDPFRFDGAPAVIGPITSGQISAAVLATCAGVLYFVRRGAAAKRPEAYRQWEGGPWTPAEGESGEESGGAPSRGAKKKKKKKKKRKVEH
jgi:prolipoprotein diacylglyceryltransferase